MTEEESQDQQAQAPQTPSGPAGHETRDQRIGESRKALVGEVPPRFGLVADPGQPTGHQAPAEPPAAPDAAPATTPSTPEGGD
jgi:hypothetical protein